MKYIFILGQSADLAKQEILALKPDTDKVELIGDNFLLSDSRFSSADWFDNLGGTVKIARYLTMLADLRQLTTKQWQSWLSPKEETKLHFGFSLYNGSAKDYQFLHRLALDLKKELKSQKQSVRLVSSREPILSSVIVSKNNLLNNELIVIKQGNQWQLGLTEAVQDFANFGYRDVGRPQRDDQSGMLPPKVARMMINLVGPDRQKTILDPFCGSGTILQEAALLNFKTVCGSDQSPQAVADSQANINWLRENFNTDSEVIIKKTSVENLSRHFSVRSIDLIVTEPFMGPAREMHRQDNFDDFMLYKEQLQKLYLSAWQEFRNILKPSGEVIFIFPIFNLGRQKIYTLDLAAINQLGFELIKPDIKSNNLSASGNLVYSRPQQKVQREITRWRFSYE